MGKRSVEGKARGTSGTAPVSPFCTGSGGSRFEMLVASYYVVSMLRGDVVQGLESCPLQEVRLQQRNLGYPIDDIVLVGYVGSKECTTALQVRHQLRFSKNPEFHDVLARCWELYNKPTFNRSNDRMGLAIGEVSNTKDLKQNLQDVLRCAETSSNGQRLYKKISIFARKKRYYDLFQRELDRLAGRGISKVEMLDFLRCFVVLSFDFDSLHGMHSVDCLNKLKAHLQTRRIGEIKSFFSVVLDIVGMFATRGGELNNEALERELPSNLKALLPSVPLSIERSLVKQVTNQLIKQKNCRKYIPGILVEVSEIKDRARLFTYPSLFLQRAIEKVRRLNFANLNRYLRDLSVPRIRVKIKDDYVGGDITANIDQGCESLILTLNKLKALLHTATQEGEYGLREKIPKRKLSQYEHLKYLVWFMSSSLGRRVNDVIADFDVARTRVLLLLSKAGAGKTNFVCDLADRFLLRHEIPSLFFSGKELAGENANAVFSNMLMGIPGVSASADSDAVIADIERLCRHRQKSFVIVVDAINEHPGLPEFSLVLEKLIEHLMTYDFTRVILTCRAEYFSDRFSNLQKASFADRMKVVEDLHFSMSDKHRDWMVRRHLEFFKVSIDGMSDYVKEVLENDPLLLRVFCEAYGDSGKNIPWMSHIYRDEIFRTYLERKLHQIAERKESSGPIGLGTQQGLKKVLRCLLSYMLEENKYSDIPLLAVDPQMYADLELLLEEEIIIRKDIVQGRSMTDPSSEVLNFTYDEFRDFLIADYLVNELSYDKVLFEKALDDLIEPASNVAEGIAKFIFYAAKRPNNAALCQSLQNKKWYVDVFADCILELEDEFVTVEDLSMLSTLFASNPHSRQGIFYSLVTRYVIERHKHLNIKSLFKLLEEMDPKDFEAFMDSGFGGHRFPSSYYFNRPSPADELISQLSGILTDLDHWDEGCAPLAELLVYLFAVDGRSYLPAVSVFREFASQHPELAQQALGAHVKSKHERVCWSVERLLQALHRENKIEPRDLVAGC